MPTQTFNDIALLPVVHQNEGKQPQYILIYEALLNAIRSDPGAIGKYLPIERQIADHFTTSRLTARQAIELLERNGFVQKRRGKQTLILRTHPIPVTERPLQRFTDVVKVQGAHSTRILSYEAVIHPSSAQTLCQSADEMVYRLRLERIAEHGRIGFGEIYLPKAIGQRLTIEHFENAAAANALFIYAVVQKVTGVAPDRTKVSIGATDRLGTGEETISRLMPDRPLLRISYLFTSDGNPIQLTTHWYDASFYTVTFDLTA